MRQAFSDQMQDHLNFHMYNSTRSKEIVTTIFKMQDLCIEIATKIDDNEK